MSVLSLSVVVPAHRADAGLERCLQALAGSRLTPHEVLVVANTTEAPLERAAAYGFRGLYRELAGAAEARNLGAAAASGEVIVFVDSDVEVRPDTLEQLERLLRDDPELVGVFGSYDADPAHRNVCSLYVNLRHHYVHQRWAGDTGTFWTGCGAIRRSAFEQFRVGRGGFDVEDVVLGMNLAAKGKRLRLHPEVQVRHHKRWSFASMLKTDILLRAVPWSRRLLETRSLPPVLNLDWSSRWSALAAWLVVAGALAGSAALCWQGALALLGLNVGLARLFLRSGGPGKGLACCALHVLYYLYSSATFAGVSLAFVLERAWRARR